MADDKPRVADVGFAEFTATLIRDTFEGVLDAQIDQERAVRHMLEILELDDEDFLAEALSSLSADDELKRLFPADDSDHAVVAGAPYKPANGGPESPEILRLTGYEMQPRDFDAATLKITESGAEHVKVHVRHNLARAHRSYLSAMVRSGVPRVVVDSGRISAKLTFTLTTRTGEEPNGPRRRGGLRRLTDLLSIRVRPPDRRQVEITQAAVNIVGEVEVTFKTIFE